MNNKDGISLESSPDNTIVSNNISNNSDEGVHFWRSSSNIIYRNNFINNIDTVYSKYSTNFWNSTSEITYTYNNSTYTNYLGNYWSDYKEKYPDAEEIDGSGIWDTPHNTDSDKDNYPLVAPWENYFAHHEQRSDLNGDGQITVVDAVIALQMAVSGEHNDGADVNRDGRVTSVDALMILQAVAGCIKIG